MIDNITLLLIGIIIIESNIIIALYKYYVVPFRPMKGYMDQHKLMAERELKRCMDRSTNWGDENEPR